MNISDAHQGAMCAVLPWSRYHQLQQSGCSKTFTFPEEAVRYLGQVCANNWIDTQDTILICASQEQATRLVEAFNTLCDAAWTPNQDLQDRAENGDRIKETQKVLAEAEVLEKLVFFED